MNSPRATARKYFLVSGMVIFAVLCLIQNVYANEDGTVESGSDALILNAQATISENSHKQVNQDDVQTDSEDVQVFDTEEALARATIAYEDADYETAFELIKPLADAGHPEAVHLLGHVYLKTDRGPQALSVFKQAAGGGDTEAFHHLGGMFYEGEVVPLDHEEALKWFISAAEQGYVYSQITVGNMFYFGRGTQVDYEDALEWYLRAAEQGNASAQNKVGVIYADGVGSILTDLIEAEKWFKRAAAQGNEHAVDNLRRTQEFLNH
jgi:TPR repeat protein